MEIAYLLEQEKFTNIRVILLDTKLHNENKNIDSHLETFEENVLQQMLKMHRRSPDTSDDNYQNYLAKVKLAIKSEMQITEEKISGKLLHTKILSCGAKYGNNTILTSNDNLTSELFTHYSEFTIEASHFDIIHKIIESGTWQNLECFIHH